MLFFIGKLLLLRGILNNNNKKVQQVQQNMKKTCLYLSILIFLALSVFYEHYSKDAEIFHVHDIARGQLAVSVNLARQLNNIISDINKNNFYKIHIQTTNIPPEKQSAQKQEVNHYKVKSFKLQYVGQENSNSTYSLIRTENGQNFMAILNSKGQVKSHGDSFYHVSDKQQILCHRQTIQSIQILQSGGVKIYGKFINCLDSQYTIIIDRPDHLNSNVQYKKDIDLLAHVVNQQYNRILFYFQHKTQNKYFGLGQQFSHLNLGHKRPYSLLVREKGNGRSDQPQTFIINLLYGASGSYYNSYSPMPIWMSIFFQDKKSVVLGYIINSNAYFIWVDNRVLIWDNFVQIKFCPGSTVKQTVKAIAQFNGYTPPVPDWVNQGAIIGLQGGTQSVMKKYQQLKKAGTKISGLWLQDWVSKRKTLGFSRLWWNWELDRNHYKNWDTMREQLEKQNVSLLIYMNPMLTDVQNKKSNFTKNFYKQAKSLNYFIKDKQGKPFQTSAFSDWKASMLDFDSQDATKYYKNILRNAIKQTGARGLMVDFGQAYPIQRSAFPVQTALKVHNLYATKYHMATKQVLNQFKNKQIYTFSRAGYLFTPKYTMSLWAGDQSMNFKKHTGLPSCLTAMLSSSLVGYSNTHCDIGGYIYYELPFQKTSVRTQILMTRWMQLGSFSPVFRTHQGNLPQKSLQVYQNPTIAAQFAFYSQIFALLSQYRKQQTQISQAQKLPLIRPMFLQNQDTPQVYQISDQYYLGSDILVSPILTAKSYKKYFVPQYQPKPENRSNSQNLDEYEAFKHESQGQWVNIWTNMIVQACNCYTVSYDVLPPVLIKANSPHKNNIVLQVRRIISEFKNKIIYLNQLKYNEIFIQNQDDSGQQRDQNKQL